MTQAAQRKSQETARRIADAIARLKAGRPEHPDLRALPSIRVSVHAVAIEAALAALPYIAITGSFFDDH